MNGFIEVYMDARGIKGAWEGVVYYVNHEKTEKIHRLADNAQWFEDHLPIDPRFRKPTVQGISARAIEVVFETGDSGPVTPIGVNLPNDQRIREAVRQQVRVAVERACEAYEQSTLDSFRHEFCWDDAEIERAKQWGAFAGELTTEIHEVLGHGSGRMARRRLGAAAGAAEGAVLGARRIARGSGGAVFRRRSRIWRHSGLVPAEHQADIVRAEYEAYARNALVQLRRVREGTQLEEDHMRNRQAIVHWLMAHTSADRDQIARGQDLLRARRRRRVPRGRRAAARRSAAHQVRRRLPGGEGAVRDLRRALRRGAAETRSSRASIG